MTAKPTFPESQTLECGVTVCCIDPSHLKTLYRVGGSSELSNVDHTGWYTNIFHDETLGGEVWITTSFSENDDDESGEFYAVVFNGDNDCHYVAPMVFETAEEAAIEADYLAEKIAEYGREYDEVFRKASSCLDNLRDAHDLRRAWSNEVRNLRRLWSHRSNPELRPVLKSTTKRVRQLCWEYQSAAESVWREIGENKPDSNFKYQARFVDAWSDGWKNS